MTSVYGKCFENKTRFPQMYLSMGPQLPRPCGPTAAGTWLHCWCNPCLIWHTLTLRTCPWMRETLRKMRNGWPLWAVHGTWAHYTGSGCQDCCLCIYLCQVAHAPGPLWPDGQDGTCSLAREFRKAPMSTGSPTSPIMTSCYKRRSGSGVIHGIRAGRAAVCSLTPRRGPHYLKRRLLDDGIHMEPLSLWVPHMHKLWAPPLHPVPPSTRPTTCSCSGPSTCWWPAVRSGTGKSMLTTCILLFYSHKQQAYRQLAHQAPCSCWTGCKTLPTYGSWSPEHLSSWMACRPLTPAWWAPCECARAITMTCPSFTWSRTYLTGTPATGPSTSMWPVQEP